MPNETQDPAPETVETTPTEEQTAPEAEPAEQETAPVAEEVAQPSETPEVETADDGGVSLDYKTQETV